MKLNKYCIAIATGVFMMSAVVIFTTTFKEHYEKEYVVIEEQYMNNSNLEVEKDVINKPFFDENGKIFLPLRDIVEEIGGKIELNNDNSSFIISLNNLVIEIKEGYNNASVNGYSIYIEDIPRYIEGSLYVSSEFIENNFGLIVTWNEVDKILTIKKESNKVPIININRFNYSDVDMEYIVDIPVIVGLNDKKYEENINNYFRDNIMEEIKEFVNQSKQYNDDKLYHWNEKISWKEKSPKIISFVYEGIKDDINGLNSNIKKAVTINLDKQKFMNISDFFKSDDYKDYIVEKIVDIINSNPEQYLIDKIDISDNFYLEDINNEQFIVIFLKNNINEPIFSEFKIKFSELKKFVKSEMFYLTRNN